MAASFISSANFPVFYKVQRRADVAVDTIVAHSIGAVASTQRLTIQALRISRTIAEDEFEWDEQKAAANLAKHAIGFQIARQAFDDPAALDRFEGYDNGEERFNVLGMVQGRLLFVAYTIRNGRKRIISARLAVRYEKRLYHEGKE